MKLIILAAAALLVSIPAEAQSASDDLICKLAGECTTTKAPATREKPQTRGFTIAKKPQERATTKAQPAPKALTKTVKQAPVGRATINVTFVSGSSELTESGRRSLASVASAFNAPALSSKKFRVEGHTDARGDRAKNITLSQKRAQSVVDFLSAQGVKTDRFEVRGYGPDKPVSKNDSANRRVEVVVVR